MRNKIGKFIVLLIVLMSFTQTLYKEATIKVVDDLGPYFGKESIDEKA